jgi:hypothetical protein
MNSSMPQSGAAPSSPNAMPGGLGAILQQPNQAPKGASAGDMAEMMAMAKKLSDSELADVLNGRSIRIPQSLAMIVAMGRKQLRTAMQGAQAQQQAQQPSVKDRLLAEEAAAEMPQGMPMGSQQPVMAAGGGAIDMNESGGIAALPAPNMDSVDMAGGGIVAFQDNEDQPVREGMPSEPVFGSPEYNEKYGAPGSLKRRLKGVREYYASPSSLEGVGRNISNTATAMAPMTFGAGVTGPAQVMRMGIPQTGGMFSRAADIGRRLIGTSGAANAVLSDGNRGSALPVPTGAEEEVKPPAKDVADDTKAGPAGKGDDSSKGGLNDLASFKDLMKQRTTDYLSKFEGLGDKTRAGIAAIDKDTQAQVLFDAMSALTGNRNLAEAGSKFGQLAAARVGARGKEKRDLEKQANEYDFNIAKAREAAEKGDITLALQYQQLANQNKYQMGSLDVARQRNAIMGEAGNLGKVQLGLKNADAQALAEAKQRFPVVTKTNQAAFDAFLRKRANELKMQNPLTKQYANLDASDIGGMGFNVVQSLPKGASVVDI